MAPTSVTLHRRALPPGTAVTYAWHAVTHGHIRFEGEPPKKLDLFLRESRTTKTEAEQMYVRWDEKSTRTIVDGGEPKIEVSPLVGKAFHLVKADGHWWVVDDEGKPCKTEICHQAAEALDPHTRKLAPAPSGGPSAAPAQAPSVLAFETPIHVGDVFDDASALFEAGNMDIDGVRATLDEVEGTGDDRRARFSVEAVIRMGFGASDTMKLRAKGSVAVFVDHGRAAASKLEGPFRIDAKTNEGTAFVVDGRMILEEQWTYVSKGG